jgi:hypothetical protein
MNLICEAFMIWSLYLKNFSYVKYVRNFQDKYTKVFQFHCAIFNEKNTLKSQKINTPLKADFLNTQHMLLLVFFSIFTFSCLNLAIDPRFMASIFFFKTIVSRLCFVLHDFAIFCIVLVE